MRTNKTHENELDFILKLGNQPKFIVRNIEYNASISYSVCGFEMIYYLVWRFKLQVFNRIIPEF